LTTLNHNSDDQSKEIIQLKEELSQLQESLRLAQKHISEIEQSSENIHLAIINLKYEISLFLFSGSSTLQIKDLSFF
jgi:chromosome segregation ATPase